VLIPLSIIKVGENPFAIADGEGGQSTNREEERRKKKEERR